MVSLSLLTTIMILNLIFNKNASLLNVKVGSHIYLANRSMCHSRTRHKMNNHVYNNQDANRKSRVIIIIITYTQRYKQLSFLYSSTLDPFRSGRLEKITRAAPTSVSIGPVKNMYTKILTEFTFLKCVLLYILP